MSNTKIIVLVSVIVSVLVFAFFGIREIKKNEKKSFGDPVSDPIIDNSSSAESSDSVQKTEFTLEEIANEIVSTSSTT